MSTIYNLEPQPTGSAIIHTTQGDILVELFAKQTPLTCRNFLQLSLDGYYDNTIFHRLVPGFILQGGDPTGTGHGGESIYDRGAFGGELDPWPMELRKGKNAGPTGADFKDEFHSRLKFNRRGLLGMANEGSPDTNGSQFFFTLGKTDELTGKNTMFGRVGGDSIYNLAKMGEAELEDDGERPMYPVKITAVEILVNPFPDMKKRERVARRTGESQSSQAAQKKQKKRKAGGKQLLSFGDEEGDAEDVPVLKKAKYDTRIVVDDTPDKQVQSLPRKRSSKQQTSKASTETERPIPVKAAAESGKSQPETDKANSPPRHAARLADRSKSGHDSVSEPEEEPRKKSLLEKTNEEIAALKASMKRTSQPEPVREKPKTALEQLIPETSTRGRKRRPGGAPKDDFTALQMLEAFKSKLKHVPATEIKVGDQTMASLGSAHGSTHNDSGADKEGGAADEEDAEVCDLHFIANCQSCQSWDKREAEEDSGDEGWMAHTLSFAADKLGKDLSYRKKAEEELMVIDPLAKARTLKEEKKASRDAKAGGSGRAWDLSRRGDSSKSATGGREHK